MILDNALANGNRSLAQAEGRRNVLREIRPDGRLDGTAVKRRPIDMPKRMIYLALGTPERDIRRLRQTVASCQPYRCVMSMPQAAARRIKNRCSGR
jgi:hypothetical protein